MEKLFILPLMAGSVVLCLLAFFCYNCIMLGESGLWNSIMFGEDSFWSSVVRRSTGILRRTRIQRRRETVTAPTEISSNRPNNPHNQTKDEQDQRNPLQRAKSTPV